MKKNILLVILLLITLLFGMFGLQLNKDKINEKNLKLAATIVSVDDNSITLIDKEDIIYLFNKSDIDGNLGDNIIIEYSGVLDKNNTIQSVNIINSTILTVIDTSNIPESYQEQGMFSNYYAMAYNKLQELSLEEKIGQLILARYPKDNLLSNLEKYQVSGYVFYEKDFKNKTETQVKAMIKEVQEHSKIPLLIAVDEEGGSVVRVSSNPNLSTERFKSPRELYLQGGMSKITEDTINKSKMLANLGINLNLAPVIDVSINLDDYIYNRTIGENTEITSLYAKTVISASKNLGVSYTLKHFPGYSNNSDTHTGSSVYSQSYESIMKNDIPPFKSGINSGAEAVLVSHNIVTSIDDTNPASLSPKIHNLLRNEINFTGVIITDDIHMGATKELENAAILAVLAGNNLIISTDYINSINSIKESINNGNISEALIDKLVLRVLAWKYYKNLM